MSTERPRPQPPLPALLLGVSTKMYFTYSQTNTYLADLCNTFYSPTTSTAETPTLFVIPSFPSLGLAAANLRSTPHILLGAQDCHWEDYGPWTGEVSPAELADVGCSLVELGHAERRRAPFNETNEIVAAKAAAAVRNGLVPLVCIGEVARSKVASEGVGLAVREVIPQVKAVLESVPGRAGVVFAYEPVWAIGAEEPAGVEHVRTVVGEIKRAVNDMAGRTGEVRVIYGGSAGPGTWKGLSGMLDGLFLGRFAHDLSNVERVVKEMEEAG